MIEQRQKIGNFFALTWWIFVGPVTNVHAVTSHNYIVAAGRSLVPHHVFRSNLVKLSV